VSAAFFDTTIIAHAADSAAIDAAKRDAARALMLTRSITTSTQVVLELYSLLHDTLAYSAEAASDWVRALQDDTVIALSPADCVAAIGLARQHDISHWHALTLVAADKAGLDIVYSEHLSHGQTYGNVRVCNPFIEDFLARK